MYVFLLKGAHTCIGIFPHTSCRVYGNNIMSITLLLTFYSSNSSSSSSILGKLPFNSLGICSRSLYSLTPIGLVISFKEYSSINYFIDIPYSFFFTFNFFHNYNNYATKEFVQPLVAQIQYHYILQKTFAYILNSSQKNLLTHIPLN